MGDSMDDDLLPELSGETWVAATFLEEVTADLEPASLEPDFITASWLDNTLITVREWIQVGSEPTWSDCAEIYQLIRDDRLWRRRAPPASTSQLVVPLSVHRSFIQRYHDSIFTGCLVVYS